MNHRTILKDLWQNYSIFEINTVYVLCEYLRYKIYWLLKAWKQGSEADLLLLLLLLLKRGGGMFLSVIHVFLPKTMHNIIGLITAVSLTD